MTPVIHNPALIPPGLIGAPASAGAAGRSRGAEGPGVTAGPSFADVLSAQTAPVQAPRFSRHALERVARRGIELNQQMLERLAGGVSRAAGKGSRDAVVFVDRTAFVVSVPNNTVITAVSSDHMREHVFTNIDSAVIA